SDQATAAEGKLAGIARWAAPHARRARERVRRRARRALHAAASSAAEGRVLAAALARRAHAARARAASPGAVLPVAGGVEACAGHTPHEAVPDLGCGHGPRDAPSRLRRFLEAPGRRVCAGARHRRRGFRVLLAARLARRISAAARRRRRAVRAAQGALSRPTLSRRAGIAGHRRARARGKWGKDSPLAATTRMTLPVTQLDPRTRFFPLLVPRFLTGRVTRSRLAGYAGELDAKGSRGLAEWCWKRTLGAAAQPDEGMHRVLLDRCLAAGRFDIAERLVLESFRQSGVLPDLGLELVGKLAACGRFDAAERALAVLLDEGGEHLAQLSPAPAWPVPPHAADTASKLRALARGKASPTLRRALDIELARLCFSFAAFGASAALFQQASNGSPLEDEDRIAYLYALKRLDRLEHAELPLAERACEGSPKAMDPDWRMLEAAVAAAAGDASAAARAAEADR